MPSAPYHHSSYPHRASLRRRAIAFLFALIVNGLILVMLLRLASPVPHMPDARAKPLVVELLPEPTVASTRSRTPAKVKRASGGAAPKARAPVVAPSAPALAPAASPLSMLIVSKEVFAAADISKIHGDRAPGAAMAGAGAGEGSGSSDGAGDGPGGEHLYRADWYREPTHAELSYLPPNVPVGSWGEIACRTVPDYRVEDCVELGESPPGSGMSRGVRQAAWQFRVRPPRVGERRLVGSWVRIRISITENGEK